MVLEFHLQHQITDEQARAMEIILRGKPTTDKISPADAITVLGNFLARAFEEFGEQNREEARKIDPCFCPEEKVDKIRRIYPNRN